MQKIKVYRVEHAETGKGPMSGGCNLDWWDLFRDHPAPEDFSRFIDFLHHHEHRQRRNEYFHGVESLQNLYEMFRSHDVPKVLEKCGYQLAVYEVDKEYIQLQDEFKQVVFRKASAVMLEKKSLVEVFSDELAV